MKDKIKKITRKEIKEAAEFIFNQPPPKQERQFAFWRYCREISGFRNSHTASLCSDPKCHNCREFERLFQEEANRQLEEFNVSLTKEEE